MLDSGCTDHITSDISDFSTYHTLLTPQKAWFADKKSYTNYIGIGTVKGMTQVNGKLSTVELHNVLYSPEIGGCFFSIPKTGQKGFQTTFTGHHVLITKGNGTLRQMSMETTTGLPLPLYQLPQVRLSQRLPLRHYTHDSATFPGRRSKV